MRVNCHLFSHTFCYLCIQKWAVIKKSCPLCKGNLSKREPEKDLLALALVDDLGIMCCHEGCSWVGVESIRKKHQRCCGFKPKNKVEIHEGPVVEICENEVRREYDLTL